MELTDYERKLAYHSLMLKACKKRQQIRNIQKRVAEGNYTTDDEIEIEKRIHLRELQATKAEILAKKIINGVEHLIEGQITDNEPQGAVFSPWDYAEDAFSETLNFMSDEELSDIDNFDNEDELREYLQQFFERT